MGRWWYHIWYHDIMFNPSCHWAQVYLCYLCGKLSRWFNVLHQASWQRSGDQLTLSKHVLTKAFWLIYCWLSFVATCCSELLLGPRIGCWKCQCFFFTPNVMTYRKSLKTRQKRSILLSKNCRIFMLSLGGDDCWMAWFTWFHDLDIFGCCLFQSKVKVSMCEQSFFH